MIRGRFSRFENIGSLRVIPLVLLLLTGQSALAVDTAIEAVYLSTDITVRIGSQPDDEVTIGDENIAVDNLSGAVSIIDIGEITQSADVDAYFTFSTAELPSQRQLVSFDTTVRLPGGLITEPRDIIVFDGVNYGLFFKGARQGVPAGVNLDAVSLVGGLLYLSFDTSVVLGELTADDEDVVAFNLVSKEYTLVFDGSDVGVPEALDVVGVHIPAPGRLHLTFDGSGQMGGIDFDDDDILEYLPGTNSWQLIYDGSSMHSSMSSAGIDALHTTVVLPPRPGDLNNDGSVDLDDMNLLLAARNDTVPPADAAADLDDDGIITVLDARKLVLLCDNPRCAR